MGLRVSLIKFIELGLHVAVEPVDKQGTDVDRHGLNLGKGVSCQAKSGVVFSHRLDLDRALLVCAPLLNALKHNMRFACIIGAQGWEDLSLNSGD